MRMFWCNKHIFSAVLTALHWFDRKCKNSLVNLDGLNFRILLNLANLWLMLEILVNIYSDIQFGGFGQYKQNCSHWKMTPDAITVYFYTLKLRGNILGLVQMYVVNHLAGNICHIDWFITILFHLALAAIMIQVNS